MRLRVASQSDQFYTKQSKFARVLGDCSDLPADGIMIPFIGAYFGCTLRLMNSIKIGPSGEFSLGRENFVAEVAVPPKDGRPSTSEAFTIVRTEPYLRVYEDLAAGFSPRSILKLGIFQGGSYVFLDKLSKPRRMSAVEIRFKACGAAFGLRFAYRESVCSLCCIAVRR